MGIQPQPVIIRDYNYDIYFINFYRLLFQPVTVPCGHSFCRECLARLFDHSPYCPVCRASLGEVSLSLSLSLSVNASIHISFSLYLFPPPPSLPLPPSPPSLPLPPSPDVYAAYTVIRTNGKYN